MPRSRRSRTWLPPRHSRISRRSSSTACPPYLIVLGGGYVGLELAQTYGRFGSRVTIVEQGPRLAGREDPDVADAIARIFSEEGIEVLVAAETRRVKGRSGEGVSVTVRTAQGERTLEGSSIIVAAGRTP